MKLKSVLLILLIVLLVFAATAETVEKEKRLTLTAEGIESIRIDCGSGYLKIKGVEGLKQIEVEASLVVKGIDDDEIEGFMKDRVTLKLEKRGSKAKLTSKVDSGGFSSLFRSRHAHIDLEVRVPKKMDLDIDDGSGYIKISDIGGNIQLDDGSGSIEVRDVEGNVEIDDGSGSIDLENIGGNVKVEDGSGSIELDKAGGDVSIDDNSGSISVYRVKGSVEVDDGSGGIVIDGVDKDVYIKRAGSGSLSIRNVKGKVSR
jgi:DUF4097 and DUF4098 domain-containing protein YvlB